MKSSPRRLLLTFGILAVTLWPKLGLTGKPTADGSATPSRVTAASAAVFLNSIGINTHVDQGYDPGSYLEPLRYTGIRQVRDGTRNISADIMIHQQTGVRFALISGGDLRAFFSAAKHLAQADALLALEGPNEPNNFPIVYDGRKGGGPNGSWVPVAEYQKALYAGVRSDPVLRKYPVFSPSETGAETDNVGLQFLVVPDGANTLFPKGTRFADYVNAHNYVSGNGNQYEDNQAWNAADPTLQGRWDGLYGNNAVTWLKRYHGYSDTQLPTVPRVTTETGWEATADAESQRTQGTILTNTYLAQFKRGWAYTFVYEMKDGEGSIGEQGLYRGNTPKLAAVYLHNLTALLSDNRPISKPGSLDYVIRDQPVTVHDLLLQKSDGRFELVIWDERVRDTDVIMVHLGARHRIVKVYDITGGTAPAQTFSDTAAVQLTLGDHAMIVEIGE
jgi:hypothetical protein